MSCRGCTVRAEKNLFCGWGDPVGDNNGRTRNAINIQDSLLAVIREDKMMREAVIDAALVVNSGIGGADTEVAAKDTRAVWRETVVAAHADLEPGGLGGLNEVINQTREVVCAGGDQPTRNGHRIAEDVAKSVGDSNFVINTVKAEALPVDPGGEGGPAHKNAVVRVVAGIQSIAFAFPQGHVKETSGAGSARNEAEGKQEQGCKFFHAIIGIHGADATLAWRLPSVGARAR